MLRESIDTWIHDTRSKTRADTFKNSHAASKHDALVEFRRGSATTPDKKTRNAS